ncbi:helix-turn-helix transcriptional regulator, partial [Streptomyces sp. NPDC048277]|uniref:helix-turn-helix transcriptional regulator n=1 Tax=Streptomyces sp. NPDC048277 TaxID=3155027 RepID=UPI0033D92465
MTAFLQEYLATPLNMSMTEFSVTKGIPVSTTRGWASGSSLPEGRSGLSELERKELDNRRANNRSGIVSTTPADVTAFLREYLATPLNTSMNNFAETKGISHSKASHWAAGSAIPGGRNGLSKDEQENLDERTSSHRKGDVRRDAAYVTGFLQEYLATSGMSVAQFAKAKGIPETTIYAWASGKSLPEGRNGLSDSERKDLDKRRANRGSRRNAQPGSSVAHDSYSGDQQDPAYGPPGLSQAGASAANPYLVSGMPTTTDSPHQHQHQHHEQNYEPGYPSAPYSWGQPTGPDSHQTAPAGDAYPTDAQLPSITTLVPNLAPTPYSSQQNQQHQGYDQYY